MRIFFCVFACLFGTAACGGAHSRSARPTTGGKEGDCSSGRDVHSVTRTERTAHGTRTVVETTCTVEAAPPPPRPADPWPHDAAVKFNVDLLNQYRAHAGVGPLVYDTKISSFALDGSKELASDHTPHAHFAAAQSGAPGFGSHTAENQGDPHGAPTMDANAAESTKKQIALFLKLMIDEGPGGGHHDNMLNPKYRRVGVGLFTTDGGKLYFTNDFSD